MSLVKNVTGSNRWLRPSTGESSWLEYWEKQVGQISCNNQNDKKLRVNANIYSI